MRWLVLILFWPTIAKARDLERLVQDITPRHATLVSAVIDVESSWNPWAVSSAGARGLMQLMPGTEAEARTNCGIPFGDIFDPETNIRIGSCIIRSYMAEFDGNMILVLAKYHGGQRASGRLQRGEDINPTTRKYIVSVLTQYFKRQGDVTQCGKVY